jgi:hydroxymethylpyrimidine pyrophosphatase-like HAD family hydrolase
VIVHVLACDYDGTIATAGQVSPRMVEALRRVRESGRRTMLVTGRMLEDLRSVFRDLDTLFDAVVAENGALLYFPGRRETKRLGAPPEPALLESLDRRGVPFEVGVSIIASDTAYAEAAVAAVREAGVERTLVFNRSSLMLLPGGVTKATGLIAALTALDLSPHNTVGIGDAENDHAFLAVCECAVAVADAVPALRERADVVTRAAGPAGVIEFIEAHVLNDLAELAPALKRHALRLGERADHAAQTVAAHGTRLLILGPSGSGKSTISGVLVEQLVAAGRGVCLIDPEGDYQTLSELPGVVVLGGRAQHALPAPEELTQLLPRAGTSVVLDLSAMSRTEKVSYATGALATIAAVRARSGMPHWLILDEAHHIAPLEGSSVDAWLRPAAESVCLITLTAGDLSREVLTWVNAVASTDVDAFADGVGKVAAATDRSLAPIADRSAPPLDRGEVVFADLRLPSPRIERFRVGERRVTHQRHVRKYVEGELPPERSFFFRGPEGQLNLRAPNLTRFCELAEGVDEGTWAHHLANGEYSDWIARCIKDPELARDVAAVERSGVADAAGARRQILDAIRRRYTI